MIFYLDTSCIVAALTVEAHSRAVRDWLARRSAGDLAISDWVVPEVSSALAIKVRTGALNEDGRAEALSGFRDLRSRSFRMIAVDRSHFQAAARLVDRSLQGLRSGDALHLAVAMDHADTLCTLDHRFAAAAVSHGVRVERFD